MGPRAKISWFQLVTLVCAPLGKTPSSQRMFLSSIRYPLCYSHLKPETSISGMLRSPPNVVDAHIIKSYIIHFPSFTYDSPSGWWYTYPSEKYDFISWDDLSIPNCFWNNHQVMFQENHRPARVLEGFSMAQTPVFHGLFQGTWPQDR